MSVHRHGMCVDSELSPGKVSVFLATHKYVCMHTCEGVKHCVYVCTGASVYRFRRMCPTVWVCELCDSCELSMQVSTYVLGPSAAWGG